MIFPDGTDKAGGADAESRRAVPLSAARRGVNLRVPGACHVSATLAPARSRGISHGMSEDRLILAIGRMERALARVEAAAATPVPPAVEANGVDENVHRSLQERHDRLKTRVEAAITALDGIIAKG
ncbi:hypothetical protein [Sphingomonas colocasiae]|uniref:Uncharacterized protein n=1 Tax=Sphingomonas colocasiae TaxID=1848973 RepID=A0ABS7PP82_9SPHN|nr:hypothetical protein [Sphingomonas colocasiae]MBY8823135.1 hypothetical protein [Sphingomonas colocasiae]